MKHIQENNRILATDHRSRNNITHELYRGNLKNELMIYSKMYLIRKFELCVYDTLKKDDLLSRFVHLSAGQESIAVAVCEALEKDDRIAVSYRNHGVLLARGAECGPLMAEILGKSTGYCKGRAGSMHVLDASLGIIDSSAVVGSHIPVATGSALASWIEKDTKVTACFFGDGSTSEGAFHESLNIASLYKLPIIYICENNERAVRTHISKYSSYSSIAALGTSYNIFSVEISDMDIFEVHKVVLEAVKRARTGGGPTLIECKTRLLLGHYSNSESIQQYDNVSSWKTDDPLKKMRQDLLSKGFIKDVVRIEQMVNQQVNEGLEYALKSPYPSY